MIAPLLAASLIFGQAAPETDQAALLQKNCALNPGSDDFRFREDVKGPLNRILAPPEEPRKPAETGRPIL